MEKLQPVNTMQAVPAGISAASDAQRRPATCRRGGGRWGKVRQGQPRGQRDRGSEGGSELMTGKDLRPDENRMRPQGP